MPRRLPNAIRQTKKIEIHILFGAKAGNADANAALPAAVLTATVRM